MDLRALNIVVLVAAGGLFLASGTQREHSLLADGNTEAVRTLETGYAVHGDAASLTALTQGYLDAQAPGLAISAVEGSPAKLQRSWNTHGTRRPSKEPMPNLKFACRSEPPSSK